MPSVSPSPAPVLPDPSLAALEAAGSGGSARASGVAVAPGADALSPAAAAKAGASKATKGSKTASAKKKTTSAKKTGYAASGALPKDLSFLRDAKLSVEEKLMRFLAYMNAKSEAEITKKMEELGGGAPAKSSSSGSGSGSGAAKPAKKGFWGSLLDAAKTGLPALGLTFQVLKNPTTKAMLKQLGGPVLAASASAFGFPQAAPILAKLGPQLVDYAAAGLQAVEKAAAAEKSASSSGSTGSSSSSAASGKSEQLQMMELNRLLQKQSEMFSLASNMMKAWHDTRSHIIANLR